MNESMNQWMNKISNWIIGWRKEGRKEGIEGRKKDGNFEKQTNVLVATHNRGRFVAIFDWNVSLCFLLDYGLASSYILCSLDTNYLKQLISYLVPVLQNSSLSWFVKCWHAKTDGWAASTFHSKCDEKGPTVTIIKVDNYIFGGYTDVSWSSPSKYSNPWLPMHRSRIESDGIYVISRTLWVKNFLRILIVILNFEVDMVNWQPNFVSYSSVEVVFSN